MIRNSDDAFSRHYCALNFRGLTSFACLSLFQSLSFFRAEALQISRPVLHYEVFKVPLCFRHQGSSALRRLLMSVSATASLFYANYPLLSTLFLNFFEKVFVLIPVLFVNRFEDSFCTAVCEEKPGFRPACFLIVRRGSTLPSRVRLPSPVWLPPRSSGRPARLRYLP